MRIRGFLAKLIWHPLQNSNGSAAPNCMSCFNGDGPLKPRDCVVRIAPSLYEQAAFAGLYVLANRGPLPHGLTGSPHGTALRAAVFGSGTLRPLRRSRICSTARANPGSAIPNVSGLIRHTTCRGRTSNSQRTTRPAVGSDASWRTSWPRTRRNRASGISTVRHHTQLPLHRRDPAVDPSRVPDWLAECAGCSNSGGGSITRGGGEGGRSKGAGAALFQIMCRATA